VFNKTLFNKAENLEKSQSTNNKYKKYNSKLNKVSERRYNHMLNLDNNLNNYYYSKQAHSETQEEEKNLVYSSSQNNQVRNKQLKYRNLNTSNKYAFTPELNRSEIFTEKNTYTAHLQKKNPYACRQVKKYKLDNLHIENKLNSSGISGNNKFNIDDRISAVDREFMVEENVINRKVNYENYFVNKNFVINNNNYRYRPKTSTSSALGPEQSAKDPIETIIDSCDDDLKRALREHCTTKKLDAELRDIAKRVKHGQQTVVYQFLKNKQEALKAEEREKAKLEETLKKKENLDINSNKKGMKRPNQEPKENGQNKKSASEAESNEQPEASSLVMLHTKTVKGDLKEFERNKKLVSEVEPNQQLNVLSSGISNAKLKLGLKETNTDINILVGSSSGGASTETLVGTDNDLIHVQQMQTSPVQQTNNQNPTAKTPEEIRNERNLEHENLRKKRIEDDKTTLILEKKYKRPKYGVKIFCDEAFNAAPYNESIDARLRVIDRATGIPKERILSAALLKYHITDTYYMVVEVSEFDDFFKLMYDWPLDAFGEGRNICTYPDSIDFQLTITNVMTPEIMAKNKGKGETIKELKSKETECFARLPDKGIMDVFRPHRQDFDSGVVTYFNKLNCKPLTIAVLIELISVGVFLDYTGQKHFVDYPIILTKMCQKCLGFDTCPKNFCKNSSELACAKCGTKGHFISDCDKPKDFYKCFHCDLAHLAGSHRCSEVYERNCNLNSFIIDVKLGEKLAANAHTVINVPPPDKMKTFGQESVEEKQKRAELTMIIDDRLAEKMAPMAKQFSRFEERLATAENEIVKNRESIVEVKNEVSNLSIGQANIQNALSESSRANMASFSNLEKLIQSLYIKNYTK